MNSKWNLIAVCLSILFGGLAANAQAIDQPYRLSDKEVEQIIKRVETQAETFRRDMNEALDRSHLNGTRREDEINSFVKAFDKSTDHLRNNFEHHKSVAADVQSVLDSAASIDRFMRNHPLTDRAQRDWADLRSSLTDLAQAYNVSWGWDTYGPVAARGSVVASDADLPYRLRDKDVEQLIHRVEQQADKFRGRLDSALDKSRFDGSKREDEINRYVKQFYKATEHLHDRFKDHKSVAADVQAVLDEAGHIDQFMRRYPLTSEAQREWSALRANLDDLARAYNVDWGWSDSRT
jgi:hypothetical protein